jgi:hypothetical protein
MSVLKENAQRIGTDIRSLSLAPSRPTPPKQSRSASATGGLKPTTRTTPLPSLLFMRPTPSCYRKAVLNPSSAEKVFANSWMGKLGNMVLSVAQASMLDPKSPYQADTWAADVGGGHVSGPHMSVIVLDGVSWKYRADTWNMMPPPSVAAAPEVTVSTSSNK